MIKGFQLNLLTTTDNVDSLIDLLEKNKLCMGGGIKPNKDNKYFDGEYYVSRIDDNKMVEQDRDLVEQFLHEQDWVEDFWIEEDC